MSYLITFAVYLIALSICGAAYWAGDRPLKLAAIAYIVAWVLTALLGRRIQHGLDMPVTIIDTNVSLVLVWISMRWRRLWCVVLAALAILTTTAPIVHLIVHDVSRYVLSATQNVLAICQLLTFVVATIVTVRARRRGDEGALQP